MEGAEVGGGGRTPAGRVKLAGEGEAEEACLLWEVETEPSTGPVAAVGGSGGK